MKRRIARENAFIAAFSATFASATLAEIIADSRECGEYAVDEYGEALLINYEAHKEEIDTLIGTKLKDWTLARIPRTSATILRLATAEMLYADEDIDSIVINEAVEIAKKYCAQEDYQFINGVLGAIARAEDRAPRASLSVEAPCDEKAE